MRGRSRRIKTNAALILLMVTSAFCTGNNDGKLATAIDSTAARTPRSARAQASMLHLADLPSNAKTALASQAGFVPWDEADYSADDRAGATISADEGLVVVRGPLRNGSDVDFMVAGYNARRKSVRIVALLALPSGEYKVLTVSEGRPWPDSLARHAAVRLSLAPGQGATREIVAQPLPVRATERPERWVWVAVRNQFLIVAPD